MSNSVDPDETAHYEPSHLLLCYLQKPTFIAYGNEKVKTLITTVCRGEADDILNLFALPRK